MVGGTVYKNICKMTLGRYPVISWVMYFLQEIIHVAEMMNKTQYNARMEG
jgi:hypothetical protein